MPRGVFAVKTERLYYHESFLKEFDAQVISCVPSGTWFHVVLDRTAFYPTSGGQPNDTGRLGGAAVLNVLDREDGAIVHVTDSALKLGPVHGVLDWSRRFDHMQQHTGQHLLSAAFIELFKFPTVSFHLGTESSTIDLGSSSLSTTQAGEAEQRTNQIIFENRAIEVRFGTREELSASGVRKEVDREGVLRAISIDAFDLQPCGGTHVARTGQVGLLVLRKIERQKQNWRVEFVCGRRALQAAREDFSRLGDAARQLSCGQSEVPAMLAKVLEERKEAQRAQKRLLEALAELESRELLRSAKYVAGDSSRLVVKVYDDAEPAYLRMVATHLVAETGVRTFLATCGAREEAGQTSGFVIFAQSAGLAADMDALLKECLQESGGKGGGTRDFAQGSVPDGSQVNGVLSSAAEQLRKELSNP